MSVQSAVAVGITASTVIGVAELVTMNISMNMVIGFVSTVTNVAEMAKLTLNVLAAGRFYFVS